MKSIITGFVVSAALIFTIPTSKKQEVKKTEVQIVIPSVNTRRMLEKTDLFSKVESIKMYGDSTEIILRGLKHEKVNR